MKRDMDELEANFQNKMRNKVLYSKLYYGYYILNTIRKIIQQVYFNTLLQQLHGFLITIYQLLSKKGEIARQILPYYYYAFQTYTDCIEKF